MKTTRIVAANVLALPMMAEAVAAQLSVSLSVDNPKKVESLIAADPSYKRHYPYFEHIQPLEKEVSRLSMNLSNEANRLMNKENISYSYTEYKKYRRRVFEEQNYSEKYGNVLAKIKETEAKFPKGFENERLKALRTKILAQINDK